MRRMIMRIRMNSSTSLKINSAMHHIRFYTVLIMNRLSAQHPLVPEGDL